MLPITGLVAATASIRNKTFIAERRKINMQIHDKMYSNSSIPWAFRTFRR